MVTKAIIMAAGQGTRLRPITYNKPKCMTRVAGQPILEYQLQVFEQAKISEVIVIVGYKHEVIEKYLSERKSKIKITVIHNPEFESSENIYSLWLAKDLLAETNFFLINGDIILPLTVVEQLKKEQINSIAVQKEIFHEESMKVKCDSKGYCGEISKQISPQDAHGVSLEIYYFTCKNVGSLFRTIEETIAIFGKNVWYEKAINVFLQKHKIIPISVSVPWLEVDDLADLSRGDQFYCPHIPQIIHTKVLVVDIDGTCFLGDEPIPGAIEALNNYISIGKKIYFCSNNTSISLEDIRQKIRKAGYADDEIKIITPIQSTINWLNTQNIKNIYLLGTPTLESMFVKSGFLIDQKTPEMIVIGFDKTLTYDKLVQATHLIQKGTPWLLTHPDVSCPENNNHIPDAGAIGQLLETVTKTAPVQVLGKPSPFILQDIMQCELCSAKEILVIGDRYETDIRMAQSVGAYSALVLSGVTKRQDIEGVSDFPSVILPTIVSGTAWYQEKEERSLLRSI